MSIRSAVKMIILNEDKVLLNKCYDKNNGNYHSLPGGGQETDETLAEAMLREGLEETGYQILPDKFCGLYEEICDDPATKAHYPEYVHKMYHIFTAKLKNLEQQAPTELDDMQEKSEWIALADLDSIRLLPEFLNEHILEMITCERAKFYGSDHIPFNHG